MFDAVKLRWHSRQLRSVSPEKRKRAVSALGQLGKESAVVPLLEMIRNVDNEAESNLAVSAIKAIGEPALDIVISELESPSWYHRTTAARVLGQLAHAKSIAPLMAAVEEANRAVDAEWERAGIMGDCGSYYSFRSAAISALAAMGSPARESLIALLADDSSSVRDEAADALAQLGERKWKQWFKGDGTTGGFAALAASGDAEVFEVLSMAVSSPRGDEHSQGAAARALASLADKRAFDVLATALRSGDWFLKTEVIHAMVDLHDDRAVPLLVVCTKDANNVVRREAVTGLGQWSDPSSLATLLAALRDPEEDVRAAAARSLQSVGNDDALGPLTEALRDPDPKVRALTAHALARSGSPKPILALIKLLQDEDLDVNLSARDALQTLATGVPRETQDQVRKAIADADKTLAQEPDFDKLVDELVSIGSTTQDSSAFLTNQRTRVVRIGKVLNLRGGFQLMLRAHGAVTDALGGVSGRVLEMCWDGIGEWRG